MALTQLFKLVKQGKLGKNIGIPTGIPKLDSTIYGIQRGYLYTIGASSGIGKSSFTIDIFIYNLIKNAGDNPISILLYSFEMSKEVVLAKVLSRYIYDKYNKIVTYEDILSLSKPISEENYAVVMDCQQWLTDLDNKLKVYDKPLTPPAIYATCKEWLKESGKFIEINEHKDKYIKEDPSQYTIAIWDHVGLISGDGTLKERIDLVAKYAMYFRNKCNMSGVFVQQLNRGISSVDRKTNGFEEVGLQDFKDSSGTTDASEVVIALYSPYREKIARCSGYPIQNVLKDRFILLEIIKNRFGRSGLNIGTAFFGEISMFKELPKPEEIGDYSKYINLRVGNDSKESKEDEKNTIEDKNIFKL